MNSIIVYELDTTNKRMLNDFINLPIYVYKNYNNWINPLQKNIKDLLNPKHPFYINSEVKSFIAYRDDVAVGRIMAIYNKNYINYSKKNIGHFGFFESIDDIEITKSLLNKVSEYLKSKGVDTIEGPYNPGTNYECGLLVVGHDDCPQIMMTYTPEYYLRHFENLSFSKSIDLFAYKFLPNSTFPEIINTIASKIELKTNITYRNLNLSDWKREQDVIFNIYNSAWEDNWGFVPMTKEEFYHSAKDLKMILNPKLVEFVLVDGIEAGFILALPDYNQIFKTIRNGKLSLTAIYKLLTPKKRINRMRVIMMGIKKEYRKMGLETLLYRNLQRNVLKHCKQFTEVEFSWILESNLGMNKPLIKMAGPHYKTYRLLKKNI